MKSDTSYLRFIFTKKIQYTYVLTFSSITKISCMTLQQSVSPCLWSFPLNRLTPHISNKWQGVGKRFRRGDRGRHKYVESKNSSNKHAFFFYSQCFPHQFFWSASHFDGKHKKWTNKYQEHFISPVVQWYWSNAGDSEATLLLSIFMSEVSQHQSVSS